MKRYDPKRGYQGEDPVMEEWCHGEWYSRADLIAAGVLVPVPDGEACDILHAKSQYVTDEDGELWECHPEPADDGREVRSVLTGCGGYFADTIVQPVRLVKLEDLP